MAPASGASRLVTGNHPLYAKLEARLAEFKRTEAACVFGSGYLANTGIIPVLIGSDGLVLLDEFRTPASTPARNCRADRSRPSATTMSIMRAHCLTRIARSMTMPSS